MGQTFGEPATPDDHEAIVAMVERHEGSASAAFARRWLARQPAAFTVYRAGGEPRGCVAWLALHEAGPEDVDADPGTRAAWRYAARDTAPGDEVLMLRFFVDRDAYQRVSQACNVAAVQATVHPLTRPRLSWDLLAAADPDFWAPMWTFLGYHRTDAADFTVGGRSYAVFAHDWRTTPTAKWAELVGDHVPARPARPW
jgi:hypothetical protein